VFNTREERDPTIKRDFRVKDIYQLHGCWGEFFTSFWSYFFHQYKAKIEFEYSHSEGKNDNGPWPETVKFYRNGMDVMEVVKANLHGKVHVYIVVSEKLVGEGSFGTWCEVRDPKMEYVHKMSLEFSNPKDAMMVKMILQ
jgi:hypothetical protein